MDGMLKTVINVRLWCKVGFSEELTAVFKLEKSHSGTQFDKKTQTFPIFKVFMELLSKFRRTSRIGMLKTVIKLRMCCPVVFYEEIIAHFKFKKSQIDNEIDKKPKIFKLSKFLCGFCQV